MLSHSHHGVIDLTKSCYVFWLSEEKNISHSDHVSFVPPYLKGFFYQRNFVIITLSRVSLGFMWYICQK